MIQWAMTRAPFLSSRFMWRTVWRAYIWLVCDCRRGGIVSWHGDGRGGWLCDSCGRRRPPTPLLDPLDYAEKVLGVHLLPWQREFLAHPERVFHVGRRPGVSTALQAWHATLHRAELAAWLSSPIRAAEPPALAERGS